MDITKLLFPFLSLLVLSLFLGQGLGHYPNHHNFKFQPTKLFVFGDSYVDTGNINSTTSSSRKIPNGITFPGVPSGRFSDGRVLTDFFANYLGMESPIPFTAWQQLGIEKPVSGMNFAFGGTGVFDTSFPFPNMTAQIDLFQNLVAKSLFTPNDINSSFALVSPSGNDYSLYKTTNGSMEGSAPSIISVVNQIAVNLKRIHSLGVKKIFVTELGPLGCLPGVTAPSFNQCNSTMDSLVQSHNLLLKQTVEKLNNNETKGSPFIILDVYDTISSIIQSKGSPKAEATFETPLKPCCFEVKSGFTCGSVDEHGNKMYTLCKDPKLALYWDNVHPTDKGWFATFTSFSSTLKHHF